MVFRAIKSDRARTKGVRYRSQPVLEKAKAFFKAVAWRRQQETHSCSGLQSKCTGLAISAFSGSN
jgi:hypothetical protein